MPKGLQPRALGGAPEQPYFKASMNTELQKFGKSDTGQLMFGEDTQSREIEVYGLDLSVSQDKALHAIQVLLAKSEFKGNIPGDKVESLEYHYSGLLPRLSMTYSDYFEAYGLGGQYNGRQYQEALQSLKSMAETRTISYKKTIRDPKGKKPDRYDIVRVHKPLVSFIEGFKDLEQDEASRILDGLDLPQKRQTKLVIELSPLLVDQIETFYLLKPEALHNEIKQLKPGRKAPRAVSLFIEWLLTKNSREVKISKDNLAVVLRIDHMHRNRVESKLREAFKTAKDLEYLTDYREEPIGLMVFTLNLERCKRVKPKQKREALKPG